MDITYENWLCLISGLSGALGTLVAQSLLRWVATLTARFSYRAEMEHITSVLEKLSTQLDEWTASKTTQTKKTTPKRYINGAADSSKTTN